MLNLFTFGFYPLASVGTSYCPESFRHKSVFYQNGWMNQAGFWHGSFLPRILH